MAYRNKTYVAFDGDNDIHYYYLMCAWRDNNNMSFNFYDAHDLNTARDNSLESTIKQRLQERMRNASCFVLLVGERTKYLTKFVRWEIEQALSRNLPIIVVNLNNLRKMDDNLCPPLLTGKLAVHISFKQKIMERALEVWPDSHNTYSNQGKGGPYYFKDEVYRSLGL